MKILIFTKNWLGDLLFQLPAIALIHERFPDAQITCAAPSRCREILEAHPAVKRVLVFDEKLEHRSWIKRILFALELRKETWDRAYLFHRSRTRAFLTLLAGAHERIGFGKRRSRLLTQAFPEPREPLHQVDYFLKLLEAAGIPVPPHPSYRFYVSQKEAHAADLILANKNCRRFAAFHLGANWEPKRWPTAHFARLADLIEDRWGLPVILTGGEGDRGLAQKVQSEVHRAQVISLAGETTLAQLGALFQKALLVVSGDSGPMHIASGIGAPVVALFGPTSPDRTGPRGTGKKIVLHYVPKGYSSPWYGKNFPKDGWLSQITPEQVMAAIKKQGWMETAEIHQPAK